MLGLILSLAIVGQAAGNDFQRGWWPICDHGVCYTVWGRKYPDGQVEWWPIPENLAAKKAAEDKRKSRGQDAPAPDNAYPLVNPNTSKHAVDDSWITTGVDPSHLGKSPHYEAKSGDAKRFVEGIHDTRENSNRLHVTVIGDPADTKKVVDDIENSPEFSMMRDRLLVQQYKNGDWAVHPSLGFHADGKPTILVQQAKGFQDPRGGRVIYRSNDYSMGAEGLASAIRKADPNYRPQDDPGPANGGGNLGLPWLSMDPQLVALLLGSAAVLLFLPKKASQ